jgi:hypothetical protein
MSLKTKAILKWNGIVENSTTPQKQQSGQRTAYNSSSKNSNPSSPSEQQVYTVGGNIKVEYTYGWYSASAGIKWSVEGNNKVNKVIRL